MYRVSPFTYLAEGMLVTGLARVNVTCSEQEIVRISVPPNQRCASYLADYIRAQGGYVEDAGTGSCLFCPLSTSDEFFATYGMAYGNRWRDFGIMFLYIGFNVVATFALYGWFRVVSFWVSLIQVATWLGVGLLTAPLTDPLLWSAPEAQEDYEGIATVRHML